MTEKINRFHNELEPEPCVCEKEKTTISKLFDIAYGQHELNSKRKLELGSTPLISSQGVNNGCYGFYDLPAKYNKPVISVPRTGSIGMAFVQEYPCCIDDNCLVLSPKEGAEISIGEMYFVATAIRMESWRYRYGRQVTENRLNDLELDFSKYNCARTNLLREKVKATL